VALTLYRRHRRECKASHPEQSFSTEFDERKRGWKRCECPIVVSGTLQKRFKRHSTNLWEWGAARSIAEQFEAAGRWEGISPIATPPPPPPEFAQRSRTTVELAVKTFLAELQETIASGTHKKYRLLLTKFKEFSTARGYVMIDQWETPDVREFRTSWAINPRTGARRMAMLKPFFEYCVSNEWVMRNPAQAVKNPKGREMETAEQRLPFTDVELKKMYDACPKYGTTAKHKWTGDDVADFISLSIYTGLRISDVALFNIDRMNQSGEIRLRTTKAGTHVYTWVPQWLQERVRARAKVHGEFIFGSHATKDLDVITEGWRRKLQAVWKLCGPWKVEPTPHRFRHTFARILLQKPGVTVRDVAELLGNTEEMIRKHYGAWVPERQERLTRILREAFDDKPRPRLAVISGGGKGGVA
jgi:site-specific recombinase XerD